MKDALISWKNKIKQAKMVTIKMMILWDKLKANVYTLQMPKTYGVVYNKHIVRDDYTTLPYGFLKDKNIKSHHNSIKPY